MDRPECLFSAETENLFSAETGNPPLEILPAPPFLASSLLGHAHGMHVTTDDLIRENWRPAWTTLAHPSVLEPVAVTYQAFFSV